MCSESGVGRLVGENPTKEIAFPECFDMEDRVTNIEEPMRILMISAEGPPMLHAGALIDVMDALPHELRSRVHHVDQRAGVEHGRSFRSEEHTSELQSHLNLVCRLLLEKKKFNTR